MRAYVPPALWVPGPQEAGELDVEPPDTDSENGDSS